MYNKKKVTASDEKHFKFRGIVTEPIIFVNIQDRRYTHIVLLRRVCATTVAVEKQEVQSNVSN